MAFSHSPKPGIYWQSRMGNNADGIGGNSHLYEIVGQDGQAHRFIVDRGVKFANGDGGFGADFATAEGVLAHAERGMGSDEPEPEALLITHFHEDHIGAIRHDILMGYKLPPLYGTAPTLAMVGKELATAKIPTEDWPEMRTVEPGRHVSVAGADIEFVPMDHLPGASALSIRTPEASVFHTGDWKFDETLPVGVRADLDRLREIGAEGVDLVVCDSTSASTIADPVSEDQIRENLTRLVAAQDGKEVVAGLLSSQLDRLVSLGRAAAANNRTLVVKGWSLEGTIHALESTGEDLQGEMGTRIVPWKQAQRIPREERLVVTTGAFGQANAGLGRAADHARNALPIDGDTVVVIPQRVIPPVKDGVAMMVAKLEHQGATVLTAEKAEKMFGAIHQTGHPIRKNLETMYGLLKPKFAAPIHGNEDQLDANADVARALAIDTVKVSNGAVVEVSGGAASVIAHEEIARIHAQEGPWKPGAAPDFTYRPAKDHPIEVAPEEEIVHAMAMGR